MPLRRIAPLAFARGAGLAGLLLATSACGTPSVIADGRCGNGLLEPNSGEDCDGYAPAGQQCGLPGTAAACRYICSESSDGGGADGGTASYACPGGYSCGLDGICRASAGRFSATSTLPFSANDILIGDVNGDHRTDFITLDGDGVGVYLGGLYGGFTRTAGTPADSGRIALSLGHLTTGIESDAALLVDGSPLQAIGESTGELAPVPYPLLVEDSVNPDAVVPLRLLPPYTADTLVRLSAGVGAPKLLIEGDAAPDQGPLATLMGAGPMFSVTSPGADIDAGGNTADEIAITFAGSPSIAVLSIDCSGTAAALSCSVRLRAQVMLPMPGLSVIQLQFADVDGDGLPDLVIGLDSPSSATVGTSTLVAFNDGKGGFAGDLNLPGSTAQAILLPALDCGACPSGFATVQRVADLDGDGQPDFVTDNGIDLIRSISPFTSVPGPAPATGEKWTESVVADFDHDGDDDVVVVVAGDSGVDELVNAGGGVFNHRFASTSGSLDHGLCVGDYDGDGLPDLAVISNSDRVEILFTDDSGQPHVETLQASVEGLNQLTRQRRGGGRPDDLLVDFGIPGAMRQLSRLSGDGGRLLFASLGFDGAVDYLALGRFNQTPGGLDDMLLFIAAGGSPQREVWLQKTTNPIGGVPANNDTRLNMGGSCDLLLAGSAPQLAVTDLNRDGTDELVAIGTTTSPIVGQSDLPAAAALWAQVVDGKTLACHALDNLTGDFYVSAIQVADANGDSLPDVIVTLVSARNMGGPNVTPPAGTQAEGFAIYFGQDSATTPLSTVPTYYSTSADLKAVAVISGYIAIVGGSQASSHLAHLDADRRLIIDADASALPIGAVAAGTSALGVADVDGDGLVDLVISGETSAVMLQQECGAAQQASGSCSRGGQ